MGDDDRLRCRGDSNGSDGERLRCWMGDLGAGDGDRLLTCGADVADIAEFRRSVCSSSREVGAASFPSLEATGDGERLRCWLFSDGTVDDSISCCPCEGEGDLVRSRLSVGIGDAAEFRLLISEPTGDEERLRCWSS